MRPVHPVPSMKHPMHPVDLNPMDFIEHDVVVSPPPTAIGPGAATSPPHQQIPPPPATPHFVGELDPFDMLEFGILTLLSKNLFSNVRYVCSCA